MNEDLLNEIKNITCSDELSEDDHYLPEDNAHIRTNDFKGKLREIYRGGQELKNCDGKIAEKFYSHALSKLTKPPDEPADDALVCRFLMPKKFLWFVSNKEIRFCTDQEFDDPRECTLPEDYNVAIQAVLTELSLPISEWNNQVWDKKRDWLISCWTELKDPHVSNLIWHKYADGPDGIGITIRYGQLKSLLQNNIEQSCMDSKLLAGHVSYDDPLRLVPFNKRQMFQGENEVRFVFPNSNDVRAHNIDITSLFREFGLRFSPDAPDDHRCAVKQLWLNCGGADRFH